MNNTVGTKFYKSTEKKKGFIHKDFNTKREKFVNPVFMPRNGKQTIYLNFKEDKSEIDPTKIMSKTVYTNKDSDKKHFVELANTLLYSKYI